MPRNGSGTYTLPSGNPVVIGTTITDTWANTTLTDIGTAVTQSIASTGVTTPSANLPMGGFLHTGVGNATTSTCYSSVKDVQNGSLVTLSAVAGTNTITATAPLSVASYVAGQSFRFVAANANTNTVTINLNSLGAKAITKFGTTPLNAGDIPANSINEIVYDGTQFQLVGARQGAYVGSLVFNARSSDTPFNANDLGSMNTFTSTFTQTFAAAATLGSGWFIDVQNVGTGVITFDPSGSETIFTPIGALTTIKMYPGEGFRIVCNGSSFCTVGRSSTVVAYRSTLAAPAANVDISIGLTDPEARNIIVAYSGVTGSVGGNLLGRFSQSSAYVTSASYGYAYIYASGLVGSNNGGSATSFYAAIPSNSTSYVYGSINMTIGSATSTAGIAVNSGLQNNTSTADDLGGTGVVHLNTTGQIDGVRLYYPSGNVDTGCFSVTIVRG